VWEDENAGVAARWLTREAEEAPPAQSHFSVVDFKSERLKRMRAANEAFDRVQERKAAPARRPATYAGAPTSAHLAPSPAPC